MAVPSFQRLDSVHSVVDKLGAEIDLDRTAAASLQTKDESTVTVSSFEVESNTAPASDNEYGSIADSERSGIDVSTTSEHVTKPLRSIPPQPRSVMERARAAALVLNRYYSYYLFALVFILLYQLTIIWYFVDIA